MKNNPTKITSEEFVQRIVLNKEDSLVKVAPGWNSSGLLLCRAIRELSDEFQKVNFFWLDNATDSSVLANYHIEESVPNILFFKNGELVDKLSGLTQKSIISNKINQLLNQ